MSESVRIYRVLDPSSILAARDRLAAIFAQRAPDDRVTFSVSPDGSRLWFNDARTIWQTGDPTLLPVTPQAAEIAARSYMGLVNAAVQRDRELSAAGISALFPDDCRPSQNGIAPDQTGNGTPTQSVLVRAPGNTVPDHWLVRFEAYLPTGTSNGSVPVFGSRVDIRVGPAGAIGACWVTWRFSIPQGVTPLLDPPVPDSEDSGDPAAPSTDDTITAPILVYTMSDEGTAQAYLAPYYFFPDDDDGYYFPASVYSLYAEITDESSSEQPCIGCFVTGGSGQYEYRWAAWDATDAMAGMSDLGTDRTLNLEPGCYNVVLRVTDTQTQMTVYVERSLYTSMLSGADQ
jgi:hypothetical protein